MIDDRKSLELCDDEAEPAGSRESDSANHRIQLLCDVSAELAGCENPSRFLDAFFQRLAGDLPVDAYCQFSLEAGTGTLKLVSYGGLSERAASKIEQVPLPEELADLVWFEGASTVGGHPASQLARDIAASLELRACVAYPINASRRLAGVVVIGSFRVAHFQAQELAILQALHHQIASATERRRIRHQLELERGRFKALMDHIPAGVLLAEAPSGRIVFGNPQLEEILGPRSAAENHVQTMVARSSAGDESALARALRGERVQGHEYLYERTDGSKTWIRASGTPICDRNGRVVGSVVTCYDIDQEKRAEAALRESEEHFRMLADAAPQVVWAANPRGEFDYFNRKWFETTGLSDVQSRSPGGWTLEMHPDDIDRATEAWGTAIHSGEPLQLEIRYREAVSGQFRWHLVRAQPVRNADGSVVRWLGTSTDIDDQKRAEESLRRADRSKDEFLAMLGHELRNPLAAVVNAASLLEFDDLDQQAAGQARAIMTRQLSNMTRMLDDLLDLARITQGKVQLAKERVDLVEIARRAASTSAPLIEARRHELTMQLPDDAVWLHADPTRLEQIVVNLLNNAAKYTDPAGKIWLAVEHDRDEARLVVRDNGMGMNREALAQAFELFAQADRSLDHSQGGLGVGLAMVKSLVKMHGGQVRAHSDGIGHGTEVVVTLPVLNP